MEVGLQIVSAPITALIGRVPICHRHRVEPMWLDIASLVRYLSPCVLESRGICSAYVA